MRSRKQAIAASVALVGVVAVGAWFLFLSPKNTEITFRAAVTSLASGQKETVTGSVTPVAANRVVILQQKMDGPWEEIDRAATDATGEFKFELPMAEKGKSALRARVIDSGRQSGNVSKAVSVKVLDPTQLEAQVGKYARSDKAFKIPGRITPSATRAIVVETSPDGETWTQAATATAVASDGKFDATLRGLAPGTVQVRVRVLETDSSAQAIGAPHTVSVEDYRGAGAKYLATVKRTNDLIARYNAMSNNAGLGAYRRISSELSSSYSKEARAFQNYAYWPQEVRRYIVLITKSDLIWADAYSQAAKAKTTSALFAELNPDVPKGAENAPTLARAALGLPKR